MKLGLAFICASLFSHIVFAESALVTNVRSGEVDGKTRFVIVTDNKRKWTTRIEDGQLVLRAPQTKSQLTHKIRALRSSSLGKITFNQQGDDLEVSIQLLSPTKVISNRAFPMVESGQARWVIDLVPDTSPIAELSPNHSPNPLLSDASVVMEEEKSVRQANIKPISLARMQSSVSQSAEMATDSNPLEVVVTLTPEQKASQKILPFRGTKPMIIAIDAGHGGKDVGAISVSGQLEKRLTLTIAKEMKRQIDALPGMSAILVRDRDVFIPLHERPRMARMMGADVFVSLHADSYHDSHIAGASLYVVSHNGASSRLAQFIATHSNNDHIPEQMDAWSESLATSIGKIALESSMNDSRKLALSMIGSLRRSKIPLQYGKVQSANFMVLKNIDMPSVLIETGFISNPEQDKLLHDPVYQKKMVTSLTKGLVQFAQVQPEPGIVYATLNAVKGDSMTSIAARHGISVDYLARANGLASDERLKVGQKLKVPVNLTRRSALLTDSRG
jgi:N-acetylmuramoyl-L-alanine amidase